MFPESRLIFRTLLHGFCVCLAALGKCDAPTPDGTLIFRLFESCICCMSLFYPDPRVNDPNDAIEWFSSVLVEVNLHILQEVWTHKIDFFFQCVQKRIVLLNICQFLFNRESTSPTLLAIVLRFLVDRLPSGGYNSAFQDGVRSSSFTSGNKRTNLGVTSSQIVDGLFSVSGKGDKANLLLPPTPGPISNHRREVLSYSIRKCSLFCLRCLTA